MRVQKCPIYFVLCCLLSCAGESVEEWRTFDLLSPVKTIIEQRHQAERLSDTEWEIGAFAPYSAETHLFFDEAGNYVRTEIFRDGRLSERTETIRAGGKISGWVIYGEDGTINSEAELTKNTRKETILNNYELAESGDKVLVSTIFSRLRKGRAYFSEQTLFSSSEEEDKRYVTALEYGPNGLLKGVKSTGPNNYDVEISFEYLAFDEAGNWTQRLDFNKEQTSNAEIVVRSYEYY
ncbi:MAG: hypothetical protein AAF433_13880 [Bacteroidota bacterium]